VRAAALTRASVHVRTAAVTERRALEELMMSASVASTRYAEDLRAHPDAVSVPAEQFEEGLVRVAERDGAVAGFAVLLRPVDGACELDAIFVEPELMGAGVGRALIEDAVARARDWGASHIDVIANPDALAFYERVGFTRGREVATRFGPGLRMRRGVGQS
jgi:GNAT superfamily N-acetyltransferase